MSSMHTLARATDRRTPRGRPIAVAGLTAAALAATAAWVARKARQAEASDPPKGRFVSVDGMRMHFVERGRGMPLVLLHGNNARLEDFMVGGLIDRLAERYHVIAFDRPGYGYSQRPRNRIWTADAQANVIRRALSQLRIGPAIVLGHSWGTLVALALAMQAPVAVRKLILVSGYYFVTPRLDVALALPPAIPIIGDALRYTVSPLLGRLLLGRAVRAMFAPQPVPPEFMSTLGREMMLRPSQIRADAEDAAVMLPSAASLSKRYGELDTPTVILAGDADVIVDPDAHSRRLHGALLQSELWIVPGFGHMLHHGAPERLLSVLEGCESNGEALSGRRPVNALA